MMASAIGMAALGRPFGLGMLYDCRSDSLVPGMTLWDEEDLKNHIKVRTQNYNNFEMVASESIEDKSSALNVDASLKASFLGGLVEVGGSAKYLKDNKTSKNQGRVTMNYKATTNFQELSMNHLGRVKHQHVFDKGLATHVVTAILYGAQAFFVFDYELSDNENHQDIQGNMKIMINKIRVISIDGQGSLDLTEREREKVEKLSCRFFGDFCLQKTPTTFQEAVEVYQSLPKLLGANGEKAAPMRVWMLPLTCLDSNAAKLVRQISIGLVQEAQKILENFNELEVRCNDALRTTEQFPQIGGNIKHFRGMCSQLKLGFQQTLAEKLPSIRGGGEEEAGLLEILKKRQSSPSSDRNLNQWMDWKEREIITIKSFTEKMKNTTIISSETDLWRETLSVEHAVCFIFTSLGSDEPYLSALSEYLRGPGPGGRDLQSQDVEEERWYTSRTVREDMRKKIKLFRDFAEANKENQNIKFLILSLKDETHKGSSIYLYKDGAIISENFEPPSKPESVSVGDINHSSVTLKVSPPRFGADSITSYYVEFSVRGEDGWKQTTAPTSAEVTVRNLKPNTEYVFRCRAVTSLGVGPVSDPTDPIRTSPCSPPGGLHAKSDSREISVSWEKPGEVGQDVQISGYMLEYAETTNKNLQWKQMRTRGEEEIITGLHPETEYAVRVSCDCGEAGRSRESITVHVCTTRFTRPAEILRRRSKETNSGSPSVYKLPLTEDMSIAGCRRFSLGTETSRQNRTIILFGETGSGKSSLIDGMMNYITGVEWEDSFRFKLVHEDQLRSHSQTSEVTVYKVNHQQGFRTEYSLTIIDTPGLVNTGELSSLFSSQGGISEVDAVCFVAPAQSVRLTPAQKYVFDSVLSIFGKDVAENIRILVTFADGQKPPVLAAITESGVPCPKDEAGSLLHFTLNNSVLFADNKPSEEGSVAADDSHENFDHMIWKMGRNSMKRFFTDLSQMETKRLTLTQEVLREIKELEDSKRLDAVKEKSRKLKKQTGPLEVYAVPLKEEHVFTKGWKCFSFGKESTKPNRTIMVLGATGAGKSTLINGMINYILGVKWEDSYRFVLVDEDQSKSQAHSQTSEVTAYRIYHQEGSQIDYTLTIVDTPGFGDTRGIKRDQQITEQIRNLFTDPSGVAEVDAVCFVAQASLARLTPTQRYVFDSILSIFGKDVAENIRILVTFADGQKPPVLAAITESGVPCPKDEAGKPLHFKFNNSALFADNKSSAAGSGEDSDEDENFDQMFWKMGTNSMKKFFNELNRIETKSLKLTQEVLSERKTLEVSVEGLQEQVRLGLAKMEEIEQTRQILRDHEAEISRNEKFEFEVTLKKPFQHDISGTRNYITNCQQCHFTCHYPCSYANDQDKINCAAMTNGRCGVCPGKCVWNVHFNQKYRWVYKEAKEKRTVKELKEKYEKAQGEKMSVQDLIKRLQTEYDNVQREVIRLMQKSMSEQTEGDSFEAKSSLYSRVHRSAD